MICVSMFTVRYESILIVRYIAMHNVRSNYYMHQFDFVDGSRSGSLRGCLHDPALPVCNEAWDCFDVLKIAI